VRGPFGTLCGYVGLPKTHPASRANYDTIDVPAHGGLTYARGNNWPVGLSPEESDDDCDCNSLYWVGFDCGHAWDISPGLNARLPRFLQKRLADLEKMISDLLPGSGSDVPKQYRTIAYVRAEVEALAARLAAFEEIVPADLAEIEGADAEGASVKDAGDS
jgi:hypothetical protein